MAALLLPLLNSPPRYSISEWAERFRYLSREYSAQPGRYSLDIVPYAKEPMECAKDASIRSVVLMWASQTTKTTLLENVCGYFIHAEPSPILMVQPTVEMAQAWSKERFNATVRDTPVLREILTEAKSRTSENTIQLKTFPGGNLAIIGSNAPAGLAGRPRRVVLLDEVDRYPASAGTEGDPVALAIRRTESFHNSVIYLTSTPTVKGLSRIENEYEQTDKRKWFCPCPTCGHWQTLEWSQVKWPTREDGEHDIESTYYECAGKGCHWDDDLRRKAISSGEWRPTAQFTGKRGYFLNGIYSPFKPKRGFKSRLHQMAAEFLEAKSGGSEQLKTWTNTFLAETWQDHGDSVEPTSLFARTEQYSPETLPPLVAIVVGGADVQKDRVELEWVGIGADDETWGIEVCKVYGDTERPETWQRVGNAINRVFKRTDGIELHPSALAIDFHYKPTIVKNWIRTAGVKASLLPVIGIGATQPSMTYRRQSQDGFFHWTIATDQAKDIIFSRMRIADAGPRYMHFPRGFGYDEQWFRQLTSERAVTKYTRGFPKRVYEKSSGARNEALDMRVYSLACVDIMRFDVAKVQAQLMNKPQSKPHEKQPRFRAGGWVNSWK